MGRQQVLRNVWYVCPVHDHLDGHVTSSSFTPGTFHAFQALRALSFIVFFQVCT